MKRLEQYGETSSKGKLIAIIIKTLTGMIAATFLIQEVDWKITLGVLALGAVANEIINFYNWDKEIVDEKKDTLEEAKDLVDESK